MPGFFSRSASKGKERVKDDENLFRARKPSFLPNLKSLSTSDLNQAPLRDGSWPNIVRGADLPTASPQSTLTLPPLTPTKSIEDQRDQALARLNGPLPSPQHSYMASSSSSYFPPSIDTASLAVSAISLTSSSTIHHTAKTSAESNVAVHYTDLVFRVKRFLCEELGSNILSLSDREEGAEVISPDHSDWALFDPEGYRLWRALCDGTVLCR